MGVGFDEELRLQYAALRRVWGVGPRDRVLDIGCGSGQTTRDAARLASEGSALGVDLSASAVERARELSRSVDNVAFECGDAQVHPFPSARFDLAISRCGMMFFRDPAAAFANIARALRPGGRLVMMTWQSAANNEWDVAIRRALTDIGAPAVTEGSAAFSLAEPPEVAGLLQAAGFADVAFGEVREPVYYGPEVAAALDWVRGFASTRAMTRRLDPDATTGALREVLAAHLGDDGVWFDARAWIITARRRLPSHPRPEQSKVSNAEPTLSATRYMLMIANIARSRAAPMMGPQLPPLARFRRHQMIVSTMPDAVTAKSAKTRRATGHDIPINVPQVLASCSRRSASASTAHKLMGRQTMFATKMVEGFRTHGGMGAGWRGAL